MIKRRFYRVEHADGDGAEDSSSSSSDSELEGHTTEEESEDDVAVEELKRNDEACSTSTGYESEDSSADEVNVDSSSVLYETDDEIENDKKISIDSPLSSKHGNEVTKINSRADVSDCILQIKSVFRCRICPNVLCLTEEFLRAHLNSKRHARSEKLMKENKLKSILNSDGEIENQETPAELHARILALAEVDKEEKKNNRRQRMRNISGKKEATSKENRSKSILNSDDQIENHAPIVAHVEDKEEKKNNRRQRRRNISAKKEATSKENRSKSILNSDGQIEAHAPIVALAEDKEEKKNNRRQRRRNISRKKEATLKENTSKSILKSDGEIENHAPIVALVEDKEEKKNNRRHRRRNIPGKKEKVLEKSFMKKSREETRKPAKKKRKSEN